MFGCKYCVLNTKNNLGKFDAKSYEAIFVCYSSTSKVYGVFNRSTSTIDEFMHVKFEESKLFMKNIIDYQIGEYMKKMSMKNSPAQEEKQKEELSGEIQEF